MSKNTVLRILPYGICIFLLAISSLYDLSINIAMYDPKNLYAIFFERYALLPILMILPIAFMGLYRLHHSMLYFIGYVISSFYVSSNVIHISSPESISFGLGLGIVLIIMLFSFIVLRKVPIVIWKEYEQFLTFTLLVFLSSMLIIFVMKQAWGRVRYREMLDQVSLFTPWFEPQGLTGHTSFPSGHTATMSVLLCVLKLHKGKNCCSTTRFFTYTGVWILIVLMMVSRMIMGAHFLSDVTMGFMITYTMFIVWQKLFFWRIKI